VRKVVAQVDNKNILMSASLLSTYRTLLARSEGKPVDATDGQMGWLYSIPDADPGDAESVDYGPLAGVGHLRIESASSHLIENRICVLCKGTGKIRCPDCHNGTIATTQRKPAYRNPITGEVHFQDDRAYITCGTCHGSGLVDCPACGGKGGQ
jgi:hypothetical protein